MRVPIVDLKAQYGAIKEEIELRKLLDEIDQVDIVVSHLPPYGIMDEDQGLHKKGELMGSKLLRKFIIDKKPKLVVCGHIHTPGKKILGDTIIINPGEQRTVEFEKN